MSCALKRWALINVEASVFRCSVHAPLPSSFVFVPPPEQVPLQTTALSKLVDGFSRAGDAELHGLVAEGVPEPVSCPVVPCHTVNPPDIVAALTVSTAP